MTLKWYDRDKLKDGDVIADFCELAGIEPGEIPQGDRNPSIGGNLLIYKLATNRLDMDAGGYDLLRTLASDHAPFRSAFHVSDAAAEDLRADSAYNARLFGLLGKTALKSWAGSPALPDMDTLESDLKTIIKALPAARRPNAKARAALMAEMEGAEDWLRLAEPDDMPA